MGHNSDPIPLRELRARVSELRGAWLRAAAGGAREMSREVPPRSIEAPARDDDALETLLDDGAVVTVAYHDAQSLVMYRRQVWLVRCTIVDGEHAGRPIAWWLRALDRARPRVSRQSAIATSYVAATGLRPPRHLASLKPSHWLGECHLRVRTRRVTRDVHGVERPDAASYSVVEAILERVAGAPPALQERR